jgi:hypothetical protein
MALARMLQSSIHRAIAVLVLLGLFAVPVSCVDAAGPHSMFAPPDGLKVAAVTETHAHHCHHGCVPPPQDSPAAPDEGIDEPNVVPNVFPQADGWGAQPLLTQLPETESVVIVAAFAMLTVFDDVEEAPDDVPAFFDAQRLPGISHSPEAPPPRIS